MKKSDQKRAEKIARDTSGFAAGQFLGLTEFADLTERRIKSGSEYVAAALHTHMFYGEPEDPMIGIQVGDDVEQAKQAAERARAAAKALATQMLK